MPAIAIREVVEEALCRRPGNDRVGGLRYIIQAVRTHAIRHWINTPRRCYI